jgi:hypothetical protein
MTQPQIKKPTNASARFFLPSRRNALLFELWTVTREYPVAWGVLKRNS